MQYLLLIHSDDSGFFALKPAEQQLAIGAYMAFTEALRKAGALVGSNRLMPSTDAAIVRVANGKSQVLDGPFTDYEGATRRLLSHRSARSRCGDRMGCALSRRGPWCRRGASGQNELNRA